MSERFQTPDRHEAPVTGWALWASVVRSEWLQAQRPLEWVWTRLRRFWNWVRRLADWIPLTWLGVLLIAAASGAVKLIAYAQLDLVWLVVGYVGLGLCALAPLFVLLSALWLKWRGPLAAPTDALLLETDVFSETGFQLSAPWYLPLAQVRWEWLEPALAEIELRRAGLALCERVKLAERGRFEHIARRVIVSDVFGLARVALRMRAARSVDVLPRYGGLRHLPALSALSAGDAAPHPMGVTDGDRLELRRYMPGDPARFIHWKVYSRTRKLMVRTPERALSIARRTAAFLVAGERDDASAAVARLAISHKLLGSEWVFGTDLELGGVTGRQRVGDALDCLMRSGSDAARQAGGTGLAAFVQRVEREGPASLLVFAPSRPGPWMHAVVAVARRHKLRVVIGIDGLYEREQPPLWQRWLTLASAPLGTRADELDEVLRALAQPGTEITVLDRTSGQQLGAAHRQAMLSRGAA